MRDATQRAAASASASPSPSPTPSTLFHFAHITLQNPLDHLVATLNSSKSSLTPTSKKSSNGKVSMPVPAGMSPPRSPLRGGASVATAPHPFSPHPDLGHAVSRNMIALSTFIVTGIAIPLMDFVKSVHYQAQARRQDGSSSSSSSSSSSTSPLHQISEALFPWSARKRRLQEALGSRSVSGWGEAARLVDASIDAERSLHPAEAAALLERAVQLDPSNVAFLARFAKQLSDLTYVTDEELQHAATAHLYDEASGRTSRAARIQAANQRAMIMADRAIQADPSSPHGHLAACIAKGRLALFSTDNKTKVKLAKEAHAEAAFALNAAPESDIAAHLLGRWNYEMSQVNFFMRTLIQLAYGTELPSGSVKDALSLYERAMVLNPQKLIHKVEAGRMYLKMQQYDKAESLLKSGIEMPVEDINDELTKLDGEALLSEVRRARTKQRPVAVE